MNITLKQDFGLGYSALPHVNPDIKKSTGEICRSV